MQPLASVQALRRFGPVLLCVIGMVAACGTEGGLGEHAADTASETTVPADQSTGEPDGRGEGTGSRPERGAGGGPLGPASGEAVGSPLRIPLVEQEGSPPSVIASYLKDQVIDPQCGGTACVTFVYVDQEGQPIEPSDPEFTNVPELTEETDRDGRSCSYDRDLTPHGGDPIDVSPGSVVTFGFHCRDGSTDGPGDGETDSGDGVTGGSDDTSDTTIESDS